MRADVLIVGGGPAGATCARQLRRRGLDVLVLDKALFPRPKLCAGWITPIVLEELGIDPADYRPARILQPMTGFRVGRIGEASLRIDYGRPVSFGIRRSEFDEYLLRRSSARLQLGEAVTALRRAGDRWIVNERYEAPLVVAAGGHFCPVARLLETAAQSSRSPGDGRQGARTTSGPAIVSEEIELPLTPEQQAQCPVDPQIPEIYFCDDLLGYGWCVRKGDYLNVGLGRADRRGLSDHVARFREFLERQGRIPPDWPEKFPGHAYLTYEQSTRRLLDDGVLWVGDAAGLAYGQSGEGIRPAVESGMMAARAILAAGGDYRREQLDAYRGLVEARFGPRAARPPAAGPPPAWRRWAAHRLLGRRQFVRHVVLDRWFLHSRQEPLP
jgi:menaquinone-9 beta-reductase